MMPTLTEAIQTKPSAKLHYIDALRGLAILAVIMVHNGQYGGDSRLMPPLLQTLIDQGARGVQLFFVASAFTLWLSMSNRKREHYPTRNFFIRRLFRIAPMYWVGLAFYSFWFFAAHAPFATLGNVVANFFFVHGLNPYWINSLVPGGWSITVEIFFYILAPWLFTRIQSLDHAVRFVLIALIINSVAAFVLTRHPFIADKDLWEGFLFLYFPSQLPVFAVGILLYFLVYAAGQRLSGYTLLLAASLFALNLATKELPLLPQHVWFAVAFLLLALGLSRNPLRIVVNPLITYIGKVSFSLYLVHFAILFLLERMGHASLLTPTSRTTAILDFGLRYILVVSLGGLISTFFHRIVEEPFQRLGKRLICYLEQ
jgi:peptidoglycan/LPS O-acetylase OafA/YrhL